MTSRLSTMTLGEIVRSDYRVAGVLDDFGLDYCCNGRRSLEEACRFKNLDPHAVIGRIEAIEREPAPADDSDESWEPEALVNHIIRKHHAYIRGAVPRIAAHLEKVVTAHGERHPELPRVASHFEEVAQELTSHMFKEEQVLFPYVCELARAASRGAAPPPNVFGTVRNPIRMMELEHASAGNELAVIRELTADYRAPEDACTTYRTCLVELQAFDDDLRRHIHLENNVLFPRAVELEGEAVRPVHRG